MKTLNITTGILNVDNIPGNAAVLLKTRTNKDGEQVTEFLAVEGVKSPKPIDIVLPLLALYVADMRARNDFREQYGAAYVLNGEPVKSGITAKSLFTRFLSANAIYKSDNNGELTKGLTLDDGLTLKNTALKVSVKHAVYSADGQHISAAMYLHAKAIIAQCTMITNIATEQARTMTEIANEEAQIKAAKETKAKAKTKATAVAATA